MILNSLAAMVLGYVFDMMFGDIDSAYSLSKLIDSLAKKFRDKLKNRYVSSNEGQTLAGSLLLAFMVIIFLIPTVLLIFLSYKLHFIAGVLVEAMFCFACINEKRVNTQGSAILRSLRRGKPLAARRNLSKLTDEDVTGLREEGIAKLSVKAIAENTFECGVAPLFFIAIGGGIGGVLYLVINRTARAVKNEDKFLSLAPRGMNDVLGLIPARISSYLAVKDARLLALDFDSARKILKRDGKNLHKINDSQTVAAFAGALDVEVVGNTYDDEPFIAAEHIGDPKKECDQSDIFYAQQLSYGTVFIAAVIFIIIKLVLGIVL
ncbi:MAG: cobalamin biosynthesis protein [Ruminococcus sp.]|nr:cobalamin biosynthesis protein [Ruminococcus sp.]